MKTHSPSRGDPAANALAHSKALHARVRAVVAAFERGEAPPESFDALACDIARFQSENVTGYGRLCAAHGIDAASITLARHAPAVPTDAFKLGYVFAFDAHAATATFRTSGTTLGARGTHLLRDTGTYDAASTAFGGPMLARGLVGPSTVLVLGPSPSEAPDSSLAHMCALLSRRIGTPEPADRTYFVRNGDLDVGALIERIDGVDRTTPAILLATSFALVHLLDAIGDGVLSLPEGSRVMQTGGYKGKSREVAAEALSDAVVRAFSLEPGALIGEYGMTELSSQFWQGEPRDGESRRRIYEEPPWARVVAVNPETLAPVADGEVGIARVEDLANVDSAFAVVTQDRVRRVDGGFELLGRAPGAPPRGCSIAIDEMMESTGAASAQNGKA